ncbi:MAG: hypothetical protein AAGG09_03235 [Pseudomonadota bacterium]
MAPAPPFNILAIAQSGRLQYEAVLLAASLRRMDPGFPGRLIFAEPQPFGAWAGHATQIDSAAARQALDRLEAEIMPFEAAHFGAGYPPGNKIEALAVLPPGESFVFLDTDTLVTGPLSDLPLATSRPTASMQREGTWPKVELYGPGYTATWKSLYDRFGLDFESSLDPRFPDEYWERYLYFNAGWFCGPDPALFHRTYLETALTIRDDPPPELALQSLDPWLDQVALPLAVHALGGGRPGPALDGLDGAVTCHWRVMPLLFARAPDRTIELLHEIAAPNWIKRALKEYDPFKRMIYHSKGARVRAMFDRANLPPSEARIRKRLKNAGLWLR